VSYLLHPVLIYPDENLVSCHGLIVLLHETSFFIGYGKIGKNYRRDSDKKSVIRVILKIDAADNL
jgi:hypothetical protein